MADPMELRSHLTRAGANAAEAPAGAVSGYAATRWNRSLTDRYGQAYRVTRFLNITGKVVRVLAFLQLAGVIAGIMWLLTLQSQAENSTGTAYVVAGIVLFAIAVEPFLCFVTFLIGVLISAAGQMLSADLDTAVNTSPFITDEQKASMMGL